MTAGPHEVDIDPWLKPLARKVGASKWIRTRSRFDRDYYFESLDAYRARRVGRHGTEPSDAALAGVVAVIAEDIGDLRAHAKKENVVPSSKEEWVDMVEAASWYVVERYYKDIAKGKWP